MKFTTRKLHFFLLFKLPAAFFTGVRVKSIEENRAVIRVKHRWINQNPFNSIYFAVLAMAAELATGVLVLKKIRMVGKPISSLVIKQTADFTKKARGMVHFTCNNGLIIDDKIAAAIDTGEGQSFVLESIGIDEQGDQVALFKFEWSIKVKPKS